MFGVFLSLVTIVVLGFIALFMAMKMLQNFQPGRNKIQKDLQIMKAELKPWIADLVPWNREEMEQLSLNQINRTSKKRIVNTSKGVLTTIYHEPVIAYSYKGYLAKGENALLYARTSDSEFIYRLKKGQTEIVIDGELIGTIHENGVLYSYKRGKPLAQINSERSQLLLPVKVNDREVGSVVNPLLAKRSNARAFELLGHMEKDEEKLFLSMAILKLAMS